MREERNVPLSQFTTLKLGGPAQRIVYASSAEEVAFTVRAAERFDEGILVLGGGSNVVIGDAGYAGIVLKCDFQEIRVEKKEGKVHVSVDAGVNWDAFVERAVDEGWSGVEALSGIPGSVGATPLQNVGAYGQEVSDTITRVNMYSRYTSRFVSFSRSECDFGYRFSRFKGAEDMQVITSVEFAFDESPLGAPIRYAELSRELGIAEGDRTSAARVRETVIRLRRGKGMVLDPNDPESVSAGSFFTNPLVDAEAVARIERVAGTPPPAFPVAFPNELKFKVPAAWLIERAGFKKGEPAGSVGISKKHALALVNRGGASTEDLLRVARSIRDGVKDKFGVELETEPLLVCCRL